VIQAALERIARERTSLVIAHRLSTVVHADNIIVLDQGEIVEQGKHLELLAKGGLYASLWARQREADEARERLARALEDDALPQSRAAERLEDEALASMSQASRDANDRHSLLDSILGAFVPIHRRLQVRRRGGSLRSFVRACPPLGWLAAIATRYRLFLPRSRA
jgi:ABC-type multidrug transport system ATPase subunit